MSPRASLSRRDFVKIGTVIGAGLTLAFYVPFRRRAVRQAQGNPLRPNGWIRIDPDSTVTLALDRTEMGQGIMTALPMILAEELEVDWKQIRVAPVVENPAAWSRPVGTGASGSVRGAYHMLRKAGAAAREMLVASAAEEWGVEVSTCHAEQGFVVHASTGRRLGYGAVAACAATLEVPRAPRLKDPKAFKLLGRTARRLDTLPKVDGTAEYGIDVRVPGLLYASVERSPVFGGRIREVDDVRAKAMPGVRHVVQLEQLGVTRPKPGKWRTYTEHGIAVLADSYWHAVQGRRALHIRWEDGPNASLDSTTIRARLAERAKQPGVTALRRGNASAALAGAAQIMEAVYEVPLLYHATMEPMNCTADVREDWCDVWAPTQKQTEAQEVAAEITGLPKEHVRIHTTFLGGGFGRRQENDYVAEAVQLSHKVGCPVQVIWSREDDLQHGFYRPPAYSKLAAGIDGSGRPVAWTHRIVGLSISDWKFGRLRSGIDKWLVEGAADIPYRIPNIYVDQVIVEIPVPRGFWRSVGASHNTYATECFVDEVARRAGQDPYAMRRQLLKNQPRYLAVLDLAAERAGWGRSLPEGWSRGIAVARYADSFIAQVAEVSLDGSGRPRVHRVVCAVDCGTTVNPDGVATQVEGGVAFGLTAALYGQITVERGRVTQSNFHNYPLLRMDEMPLVETHLVPSDENPGGVGEVAVPPVAPAVCNAIFAATGKPVRQLPIIADGADRVLDPGAT